MVTIRGVSIEHHVKSYRDISLIGNILKLNIPNDFQPIPLMFRLFYLPSNRKVPRRAGDGVGGCNGEGREEKECRNR